MAQGPNIHALFLFPHLGEWEGGMGIGGWPKSVAVWAYRLTECTAVRRVGPSSGALLDACLAADPMCKVACKTAERDSMVMVAGEITTQAEREGLGSRTQALVRNSDHGVVDAVLDACLTADPVSKVAYETATKDSMVKMVCGNHEKTKVNLLREMELNITGGQEEYLEKESGEHGEHESSKQAEDEASKHAKDKSTEHGDTGQGTACSVLLGL